MNNIILNNWGVLDKSNDKYIGFKICVKRAKNQNFLNNQPSNDFSCDKFKNSDE